MRPRSVLLTTTAVTVVLAAAALAAVPALGATKTVAVKRFSFTPTSLTVKAGTTVTWKVGGDRVAHNVTVKSGPARFHSKSASSFTFSKRLTKKGTYRIVCTIHPNMHETISVR